jgi:hypothetical protein
MERENDMSTSKAKQLKVGLRIKWSDRSLGTIVDKNWHAIMIKWDDGIECIFPLNNNEI